MSSITTPSFDTQRKKRRKIDDATTSTSTSTSTSADQSRWRTSIEQQTYSSKLIAALRHVLRRTTPPTSTPISGSRAVHEAADKTLAIAAKGRTHWSRAILSNRLKHTRNKHKKSTIKSRVSKFSPKLPPPRAVVAPIEKRVKVLGRLVPGCRKLSFPNLLEETTDYIAALQMQVRAMAALAELLSGSPPSSTSSMEIEPSNSSNSNSHDFHRDNPVH